MERYRSKNNRYLNLMCFASISGKPRFFTRATLQKIVQIKSRSTQKKIIKELENQGEHSHWASQPIFFKRPCISGGVPTPLCKSYHHSLSLIVRGTTSKLTYVVCSITTSCMRYIVLCHKSTLFKY